MRGLVVECSSITPNAGDQGSNPGHSSDSKIVHNAWHSAFQRMSVEVEHVVLITGQPLLQHLLCLHGRWGRPKAHETEMYTPYTPNGVGRA